MGKISCLVLTLAALVISGCQDSLFDDKKIDQRQKEYILSKVNNYQGMIQLYRDKLSQKDERDTRYRLAELYYQVEDYESSRHYLKPLLVSAEEEKGWLLEGKNLLETGNTAEALAAIERVQRLNPDNGEAWNLRGVLLAQSGDFALAEQAFREARLRFVDDNIVLNNLAMLAIMQEDYAIARDYLMPVYARGNISQKMLHNMVFVLVKLQDFQGAEEILRQDKMYSNRDGLLESLARVEPRPQQQLRETAAIHNMFSPAGVTAVQPAEQVEAEKMPDKSVAQIAPQLKAEPTVAATLPVAEVMPPAAVASSAVTASPVAERASLAVTGNLREISVIRAGQHTAWFRITLESSHAINYREVAASEKNRRTFELYNVKIDTKMLDAAQRITSRYKEISKLRFYQRDIDTTLMEVDFNCDVNQAKISRLIKNKKAQERLVFDIFYG